MCSPLRKGGLGDKGRAQGGNRIYRRVEKEDRVQGPSRCPTNVLLQKQNLTCSSPPGHPKATDLYSAMSPPARDDSPEQDRAPGASNFTQARATAHSHRLDPSSRSPKQPWTKLQHDKGGCVGERQAGREGMSYLLCCSPQPK